MATVSDFLKPLLTAEQFWRTTRPWVIPRNSSEVRSDSL